MEQRWQKQQQQHATQAQAPAQKVCSLPGCEALCFVEPSGRVHDFCRRGHAVEAAHQAELASGPAASSVATCALAGCEAPCFVEPSGRVHDYCRRGHAVAAAELSRLEAPSPSVPTTPPAHPPCEQCGRVDVNLVPGPLMKCQECNKSLCAECFPPVCHEPCCGPGGPCVAAVSPESGHPGGGSSAEAVTGAWLRAQRCGVHYRERPENSSRTSAREVTAHLLVTTQHPQKGILFLALYEIAALQQSRTPELHGPLRAGQLRMPGSACDSPLVRGTDPSRAVEAALQRDLSPNKALLRLFRRARAERPHAYIGTSTEFGWHVHLDPWRKAEAVTGASHTLAKGGDASDFATPLEARWVTASELASSLLAQPSLKGSRLARWVLETSERFVWMPQASAYVASVTRTPATPSPTARRNGRPIAGMQPAHLAAKPADVEAWLNSVANRTPRQHSSLALPARLRLQAYQTARGLSRETGGDVTQLMRDVQLRAMERANCRGVTRVRLRDVRDAATDLLNVGAWAARRPKVKHVPCPFEHQKEASELAARLRADLEARVAVGHPRPRVLVACEFSAVVASAFAAVGCDVCTCDLRATEVSAVAHARCPAHVVQDLGWDLVIAHPPCDYLTNAGAAMMRYEPDRLEAMVEACRLFHSLWAARSPLVAVENPVMNARATRSLDGLRPTQTVQPHEHGHGESKPLCLYLSDALPALTPSYPVAGRRSRAASMGPSPDRGSERSRFFPGVAAAMAAQWLPAVMAAASDRREHRTVADLLQKAADQDTVVGVRFHPASGPAAAQLQMPTGYVGSAVPDDWDLPRRLAERRGSERGRPTVASVPPKQVCTRCGHRWACNKVPPELHELCRSCTETGTSSEDEIPLTVGPKVEAPKPGVPPAAPHKGVYLTEGDPPAARLPPVRHMRLRHGHWYAWAPRTAAGQAHLFDWRGLEAEEERHLHSVSQRLVAAGVNQAAPSPPPLQKSPLLRVLKQASKRASHMPSTTRRPGVTSPEPPPRLARRLCPHTSSLGSTSPTWSTLQQ